MKYFRTRELNGLNGPMWGVEYTKTDGERWITTSVHNKLEVAEREMCSYIASHRDECAFWEGSAAQKIFDAKSKTSEARPRSIAEDRVL